MQSLTDGQRLAPVLAVEAEGVASGDVPRPAVEAAVELAGMAAALGQPPAAVLFVSGRDKAQTQSQSYATAFSL